MDNNNWISVDKELPTRKEGWNHTEQVALYYPASESNADFYGIGYYNFDPFYSGSNWVDFAHFGKIPSYWMPLPAPPK